METIYGVGMLIGPFLGGILYDLQGFLLPFAICGSGLLICAIIFIVLECFATPAPEEDLIGQSESRDPSSQENTTYWQLIKMPGILLSCYLLIIAQLSMSWYLPSLEPFLEEHYQLGTTLVGVMFMTDGLSYAVFSPIGGLILDKTRNKHIHLLFASALGAMVGFSLLGPAPFLNLPKSIYIVGAGMIIQGGSVAITFIATLIYTLKISVANGASDTEQTKGMVTSVWFMSQNLAMYMGTSLGGAAYDALGFENSTLIVITLQLVALVAIVVYQKTAKSKTIKEVECVCMISRIPKVLSRRGSVIPILVMNAKKAYGARKRRTITI